jgi:uncharacterized membrane protein YccC
MARSNEDLAQRIEQLVREHVAESRRMAQEAVARAFSSSPPQPACRARKSSGKIKAGRRRTRSEMASVCERLYQAVCARPGETMAVLMQDVGASARELTRPMNHLKEAGRIRSVGLRNHMRYFPMVTDASSG